MNNATSSWPWGNHDGGDSSLKRSNNKTSTPIPSPLWAVQASTAATTATATALPPYSYYPRLPNPLRRRNTTILITLLVCMIWVMIPSPGEQTIVQDIQDEYKHHILAHATAHNDHNHYQNWAQKWLHADHQVNSDISKSKQKPQENYTAKDGLLYFAPAAPEHAITGVAAAYASMQPQRHPILHLIEKAEKDWDALLRRQSTTLEEAVAEYKHRYSRSPPKGFDKWWQFARNNNVNLVDEYDNIMRDIEPYIALSPKTFKQRAKQLLEPGFRASGHTFTITVQEGGELVIGGPSGGSPRSEEVAALLRGVAQYLPAGMHATFTGHDGPGIFITGENLAKYTTYARKGRYLTEEEAEDSGDALDAADNPGWSIACLPGSNWRKSHYGNSLERPSTHSFIADVEESSDVCKHPDITTQHGFFLWNGPRPWLLYPVFTFARTSLHHDILATPLEQYHLPVGPDPAWEDKKHNKLLWRGSTTGAAFHRESHWRSSQRARLVLMANEKEGQRTVHWADEDGTLHASVEDLRAFNEHVFDVAFTGQPGQCSPEDGTCNAMKRAFRFEKGMDQEEANQYRYIFDMDGNGWSGRFHKLMMSNSAILKSTIMPEWYQNRIMPWVHYIPVKVDYTDLYDILSFFIGGTDGQTGHDELGARIARQGQEWSKTYWREVDMQAYMLRLLLEYSRLLERTEEEPHRFDYE